jgi:predicted ATPase
MQFFRDWHFGPYSHLRQEHSIHLDGAFLREEGAINLANVVHEWPNGARARLTESLKFLYAGIERVHSIPFADSSVKLFLQEAGGRQIPATRLSDGTLRYLCLLVVLLHPSPPPLIAIEEPELGLHPDLIHHVAELLKDAASRTQLVVTTHSRGLIDALRDQPESVVVCEKHDGESVFQRLDGDRMKHWLDRYSLGELWSIGELGGNRW